MNNISNFNQIFTNLYQAIRNINVELDNVKKDILNFKNTSQSNDQRVVEELVKSIGVLNNDVKELRGSIAALNFDSFKEELLPEVNAKLESNKTVLETRLEQLENRTCIGRDEVQQLIDMSINALLSSLSSMPSVDTPQNDLPVTSSEITVDISNIIHTEGAQTSDIVEEPTKTTTSTKKGPTKGKSRSKKTDVS